MPKLKVWTAIRKAREMHGRGLTAAQISKRLRVPYANVYYWTRAFRRPTEKKEFAPVVRS